MKLSLCGSPFPGADPLHQLQKTKEHGFNGLEFYRWQSLGDLGEFAKAQEKIGIGIAATCTTCFNLVDASARDDYLAGLEATIHACEILGARSIITQTGNEMAGVSREIQRDSMIETLKHCADLLEGSDIILEVEPLNGLINHPGHFLQRSDESVYVIDQVNSPNIKLVFDVYHQQITEGNVIRNATDYIDRINHYHIADNPGRQQPGTGELNYVNILKAIRETGFAGFVGLECGYTLDPEEALPQFLEQIWDRI